MYPACFGARFCAVPIPTRIRRIDASAAWGVPGVKAVVTGQDIPGHFMGKVLRDMPVLCWDRVRYIGDRVAAVAAETPDAAEEALLRIDVDYEVLPAVFDPMEAMRPDALCSMMMSRPTPERRSTCWRRTCTTVKRGWRGPGDVEGFRQAEVILEHTFSPVPSRHQGYLEPFTSVIATDDDGRIKPGVPAKRHSGRVCSLHKRCGLRDEHIRVNVVAVGRFRGQGDARDLPVAYLLAKMAQRPVKIVMGYGEELTASNPAHPTVVTIRSGVTRDGRLTARAVRTVHASGAYAMKPRHFSPHPTTWAGG